MASATLRSRIAVAAAGAATLLVTAGALNGVARSARAQDDDHAIAQAIVDGFGATRAPQATLEALANAKTALERASTLRRGGDEAHAKAADGVAREWAETARDLARATDAEAKAAELRRKAMAAQEQLERTRALVEEGIARVGRLRAALEAAESTGRTARTAVEVHEGTKKGATPNRDKGAASTGNEKP